MKCANCKMFPNTLLNAFLRAFEYMKPMRGKYFAGSALASCELIMLFAIPVINRMLVEMIIGEGEGIVRHIILITVGLLFLTPLVVIGRYWQSLCAQKTADNLKKSAFAHIQRLPAETLARKQTGDYLIRISNDADRAGQMFQGFAMVSLLRFVVVTAVTMTLLLLTDWRVAALALIYNLFCFALSLRANPYVNKLESAARHEIVASSNVVLEAMRSMPVVRVFMLGPALAERYHMRCEAVRQKRSRFRAVNGAVYGIVDFFSFSSQAVGFIAAIFLLSRGEMGLSDAVYTASLMALASDAMLRLSTFILLIQPSLVSAGRVFEILDEPQEESKKTRQAQLDLKCPEAVRLENVSFTYPDGTTALRDINLVIRRGERLALIGPSGGGKTTLAQIIASLYEPNTGGITFYGAQAEKLNLREIRDHISYVPQEPVLFEGSIYDNIALPGAGMEDVKKAAKNAGLEEFILSLPKGYNTPVGERGAQLSGGQRQRVAIARAMLKDAPLLILDEATSALDSDTEAQIQQSLDRLTEGRTSITIAHRLSTIKDSDRVLTVRQGRLDCCELNVHNKVNQIIHDRP